MSDFEFFQTPGAGIKAWIKGVELEDQARQQLENVASMPFIHKYVAAMPDVHWGKGATIGSVIPSKEAIIPAAVGVDIGCVPPGPNSRARVVKKCTRSTKRPRMGPDRTATAWVYKSMK